MNLKVRLVALRFVTASLVPAQTMIDADVYSPPPSDAIAAGVVAPVEGSTTAFVNNITRSGMSWHFADDAGRTIASRPITHANDTTARFILASTLGNAPCF
jgi:hypothetical protein